MTRTVQRALSSDAAPTGDMHAVPASPEEVGQLVDALHAEADTNGTTRTREYSRKKATELLIRVGAVYGRGQWSVPVTAYEIQALEYVAQSLRLYKRAAEVTRRFDALLALLTMRLGMARVRDWRVRHGLAGLEWFEEPAAEDVTGLWSV